MAEKLRQAEEGTRWYQETSRVRSWCERVLHCFAWAVYDRVVDYIRLETSELCFDLEVVLRSWKSQGHVVCRMKDGRPVVLSRSQIVLRLAFQPAMAVRWYTPSTKKKSDSSWKCMVHITIKKEKIGDDKKHWGNGGVHREGGRTQVPAVAYEAETRLRGQGPETDGTRKSTLATWARPVCKIDGG